MFFAGKGSRSNISSNETLDMQPYVRGNKPVGGSTEQPHANGNNRKKSILKKSESHGNSSTVGKVGHGLKHDPELENLLVSDQESANNTPAPARKPIAIVELPPTANHDQIKSLTGPKLRKSETSLKPIAAQA